MVKDKLKLGFTKEKLASDNGTSPSTIYRIKRKQDELKKYREENPSSPIKFFSSFDHSQKLTKH